MKDELLEKISHGEVSNTTYSVLPYEIPRIFINIPDHVIDIVAIYLPVVFRIAEGKKNKEINVSEIINNAKYLFSAGAKHNDKLWMHHCAASIRELIIFVYSSDFHKALSCIPKNIDKRVEKEFLFIENARSYLSCIVHFVPNKRTSILHKMYPNKKFNQMTKNQLILIEDDIFEKVCIDLIYVLYYIFDEYCISKD